MVRVLRAVPCYADSDSEGNDLSMIDGMGLEEVHVLGTDSDHSGSRMRPAERVVSIRACLYRDNADGCLRQSMRRFVMDRSLGMKTALLMPIETCQESGISLRH